jgi:hypothetical protein
MVFFIQDEGNKRLMEGDFVTESDILVSFAIIEIANVGCVRNMLILDKV